jgi:type I restriction enzyme S subunit
MIDGLTSYSDYKCAQLSWLGQIPAHWDEKRAKCLYREIDERSTTGEEELLSVSHKTGVTPRPQHVTMFKAESNVGHKLCQPEDLAINTMWAFMGALGVARQVGVVSPSYGVYRPLRSGSLHPEYVDRLLRTEEYKSEYLIRSTGIRSSRLRLYPDQFLRIPILCPPREEQTSIVRFLHHVDQRIRRYMRSKRQLIALLNEQKQAIIHRAVTRGLDPNVRLKPSGVEWLGDVPEHWAITTVRRLISFITSGSRGWALYYADHGDIFIQSGNLGRSLALKFDQVQHVTPPVGAEGRRTVVKKDDVLVCVTGALTGNVVHVTEELPPAYVNQHVALLRPSMRHVAPRYLAYVLHSNIGQSQFKVKEYGGTKQGLGLDDVRNVVVPLPKLAEQHSVVTEIDAGTQRICSAMAALEKEVSLIREYRTRLIADVVTGKLDVREAAARLPTEADEADAADDELVDGADALDDAELEVEPEEAEA